MTALLGLLAVAGYQNRDKLAEWLGGPDRDLHRYASRPSAPSPVRRRWVTNRSRANLFRGKILTTRYNPGGRRLPEPGQARRVAGRSRPGPPPVERAPGAAGPAFGPVAGTATVGHKQIAR
jgi:hypothetical protein